MSRRESWKDLLSPSLLNRGDVGLARTPSPTPPKTPTYDPASQSMDALQSDAQSLHCNSSVPSINVPAGTSSAFSTLRWRPPSPSFVARPIPDNELRALSPLGAQSALSLAQVTAELAPIPGVCQLAEGLTVVFRAVERSKVNKEQWKLLQARCVMVTRIAGAQVSNYGQNYYPSLEEATGVLRMTLNKIATTAQQYNEMHDMRVFLKFQSISDEIKTLFSELDACLGYFSYATDVAQSQWVEEFRAVQERELMQLQNLYGRFDTVDTNLDTIGQNQDELLKLVNVLREELWEKFQVLQDQTTTTVASYVDAQQTVRTILAVTKLQLPPKLLLGKQCILDANIPIKTGITCDVYPASFLGGEKVAKKVFRIGTSDQASVKQYAERFMRIAELWSDFRSDYTLPFYGIGMDSFLNNQHFQLYMVSPLMKNFDAMTYLKEYRNNPGMNRNILRIVTDAALGLQYLHDRRDPVVHSGMRGENVLITDSGGGILGGFGLTKALECSGEDETPRAVMTGKTESYRWMAPEMFENTSGPPILQTPSDVWGWGMTALEIVSGSVPYHAYPPLNAIHQVCSGPPKRQDHVNFEKYAHRPEEMWQLLEQCWAHNPAQRPTIDEVVVRLKQIAKLPAYVKQ